MQVIDLQGRRFGRLLVIERSPIKNHFAMWRCLCDCGTEKVLPSRSLLTTTPRHATRSCGCLHRELSKARYERMSLTHGHARTGRHEPEYQCWSDMKQRCYNQKTSNFHCYGGRGITVCDEWRDSYEAFIAHIGRRPSAKHSIDRINNDGNYEPGNVRWATRLEQSTNQRHNLHDIQGQRFNRWVVESRATDYKHGNTRWHCRCDCGNTKIVHGKTLKSGRSKSCGCSRRPGTIDILPLASQAGPRSILVKLGKELAKADP